MSRCTFCGHQDTPGATYGQWWVFRDYCDYINGNACPACSAKIYDMTDDEHIAARVAIKLTEDSK